MDDYEQYRPLMFSVAYEMLGSAMDAEDIVQDAFLRAQAAGDTIESPKAYLTTIVTRLCLNQLQSARVQREQYLGPWLPEPIPTGDANSPLSPSLQADRSESISMAFLVLLEELTPPERAVLLLRDVFDYGYPEIAGFIGKAEPACRQLYSRARKHLAEHRSRFVTSPEKHRQMLDRFMQVVEQGKIEDLTSLLAEDAVLWADGGGVSGAATRPIHGGESAARFILGTLRYMPPKATTAIEQVNGEAAIVIRREDGSAFVVLLLELGGEQIQSIRAIGNPDKLKKL